MLVDWIWDRMELSGGALQFTDRLEWPGGFCAGDQPIALGHLVEGREQLGPVLTRLKDGGLQTADRDGEANAQMINSGDCEPSGARAVTPRVGLMACEGRRA